jgi:type I restriction enzyme S subunit
MTDWPLKTLGEVALVGAGNSAPQDKELFKSGKHRFVRTSDVGQVRIGRLGESVDLLNDAGIEGLREFRAGVTLLPKSGASTFLNHRVQLTKPCFVSSHLAVVDPNPDVMDDSFMFYFLQTVRSQDLIQDQSYPSLNLNSISGVKVLVPPLDEQKRIVARMNHMRVKTAEMVAAYDARLQAAKNLRQSILEAAFAGEL